MGSKAYTERFTVHYEADGFSLEINADKENAYLLLPFGEGNPILRLSVGALRELRLVLDRVKDWPPGPQRQEMAR